MTRELLPLLEQAAAESGAATVVVLSSATHFFSHPEGILGSIEEMNSPQGYDAGTGYAHSKLANVLFAQELAERMKSKNVLVNSCHPGLVATSMMLNSASRSFGNGSRGVMSSFTWHPRDAAMTQIYLAVGEEITSKKITGQVSIDLYGSVFLCYKQGFADSCFCSISTRSLDRTCHMRMHVTRLCKLTCGLSPRTSWSPR